MATNTKRPWMQQKEQLRNSQKYMWAENIGSCSTNANMDSFYRRVDT